MRIYNTLTRSKEDFVPLEPGRVRMYVCGPTVYNLMHVGNGRMLVVFDTVRRYLLHKGYDVNFVMNFTDIDDKIIAGARQNGVTAGEHAEHYIAEFLRDAEGLNALPATHNPRATEEIDGIIAMISELIEKGYAYERGGTVYYAVDKLPDYGKLSGRDLEDMRAGARVEINDEKDSPMDFVLWKPAKPGEPSWPSPWSEGRPGWHIECSVMARKHLGDSIDIHAGGEDLIFPHHENEIAQSEAATGKPFVRYWMHNAMMNIDNSKMSKSKGNFLTLRDAAERYSYPVTRFFLLSAHYRSPVNFSAELIQAAANGLERIMNCARTLREKMAEGAPGLRSAEEGVVSGAAEYTARFAAAMDDDFNTANALTAIFELVKYINSNTVAGTSAAAARALLQRMEGLCGILGISLEETNNDNNAGIEALIEERQRARAGKDFKTADAIRDQLIAMGVVIKDTPEGVKWYLK